MSSTRKAKDASVFHQSRYASSPEIARGLQAYLVALRCTALASAVDRELIWFLHYLSHQAGGLEAIAKDLVAKFPDRIQTEEMVNIGITPGKICNAKVVRELRRTSKDFLLQGEVYNYLHNIIEEAAQDSDGEYSEANQNPVSYPADKFFSWCKSAADFSLANDLRELCLNPASRLTSGPWYFSSLIGTLREYQADFIQSKKTGVFTTALGQKVFEVLDYTAYCRGLTLMQGEARLGKSHAGRAWCEQHPGTARFVEVPSGNDEITFFHDLARGLGLGNFLNYKAVQIRERVESVLRAGDIVLVLDEAQRLWPQTNFREGYPKRIAWVMTMANAGVPICMIATPQFFVTQKVVEKNGWNSAQLTGRIAHYEPLPQELSLEDLTGVARTVLPEASANVLKALAVYAQSSARYLAAIDSIAKRARYIAMRDSRDSATAGDVRKAMQESVIPADTKLHIALETGKRPKSFQPPCKPPESSLQDAPAVAAKPLLGEFSRAHARGQQETPEARRRDSGSVLLAQD